MINGRFLSYKSFKVIVLMALFPKIQIVVQVQDFTSRRILDPPSSILIGLLFRRSLSLLMLGTTWLPRASRWESRRLAAFLRRAVEDESGASERHMLNSNLAVMWSILHSLDAAAAVDRGSDVENPFFIGNLLISRSLTLAWPRVDCDLPIKESGYRPACEQRDKRRPLEERH